MNGYYVKRERCVGEPVFYNLYRKMFKHNNEADPKVAWCLIREYALQEPGKKDGDLMMIWSNETGQGLGLELLNRVKEEFEILRTQWDASTVQGRELCLKAGFVREENILIYRKEDGHAVQKPEAAGVHVCPGEQEGKRDLEANGGKLGEGNAEQAAT